MTEVQKIYI